MSKHESFTKELKERRDRFASLLKVPAIVILDAAPEQYQCPDNEYRYRQDSDFYYLTGFKEPESCMVMLVHPDYDFPGEKPIYNYRLFVRPRDPEKEVWTGPRVGVERAVLDYGADSAYPINECEEHLKKLLLDYRDRHVYFSSRNPNSPASTAIECLRVAHLDDFTKNLYNALVPLHQLRVVKTPYEIEMMRHVCQLSADAHTYLMKQTDPTMNEYVLDGMFTGYVMSRGCPRLAYPNIVASGNNATILHYETNNRQMQNGDLVLIDAGGEYNGYSADITRTWPVNGKFTQAQREIYQLVLNVQKECIKMVKPGCTLGELQNFAMDRFALALAQMGVIKIPNQLSVRQFYMHGIGHWLGMDVHDCLNVPNSRNIPFQPGMILTVEPGLYFSRDREFDQYTDERYASKYRGIGVRIEDDILVTPDGCEVLSHQSPKEIDDMKQVFGQAII